MTLLTAATAYAGPAPGIEGKEKRFGLTTSLEASSNLYVPSAPEHESGLGWVINPSFKLGKGISSQLGITVNQELANEQKTTLDDTTFVVGYSGFELNRSLKYSPSLTVILPTNETSRKVKGLITGFQLGNTLNLSHPDWSNATLNYRLALGTNLFQSRIDGGGSSNSRFRISNRLILGYTFFERLGIETTMIQSTSYTYSGFASTKFEMVEELSYDFGRGMSVALGHSNSGSAFKENGRDLNVSVFDAQSSTVYGSLTYKY